MTPKNFIITIGGTAAALTAIATAWVQFGGAVPASQRMLYDTAEGLSDKIFKVEAEGKKHSIESTKWGRKIYNSELHNLLVVPPPEDPIQRQYWHEAIEDAKRQRKFYSDKEIELRKK